MFTNCGITQPISLAVQGRGVGIMHMPNNYEVIQKLVLIAVLNT